MNGPSAAHVAIRSAAKLTLTLMALAMGAMIAVTAPHAVAGQESSSEPAALAATPQPRAFAPLVVHGSDAPSSATPPPTLPPPTTNVLWVAPSGVDDPARGSSDAPLRTLAYACSRAQAGQTIRLTAGEFREAAQCALRSGVRVTGNGRAGAARTVIHAPTSWDFTGDGVTDNPAGYIILIQNAQNVIVDGIEFRGNAHRANGAVRIADAQTVTLRNLNVFDFRYTGISMHDAAGVDAQNLHIEDSGYEWPPNTSPQFPDGGSVGNLGLRDVRDSIFGFITIKTTDLHGYGIKAANLSRVRFTNLDLDMHPFQSWRGPGPGNFDMEIHGGYAELVEIAHSRFRQTLSLMGGNEPRYDAVPFTLHVHHNLFDMKNGAYCMEVGTDKMVVDHNWFRNTWTALQNYGDQNTRIRDLTVFNNVVENLSMRFVGLRGRVENLRVFGNTVYLGPGGGQSYLVTLGKNNGSRNWLLANNVIVGSAANPAGSRHLVVAYDSSTAPRDVQARNNVYRDLSLSVAIGDAPANPATYNLQFVDNLNADPALPTTGATAFQPPAGSPVVDRGDPAIGIRTAFVGAGRDVGAFERGEPAWRAGPGADAGLLYLWAPTTSVQQDAFVDVIDVDLATTDANAEIRYTLDGSEPGPSSLRYTGPIRVTQPVKLRARTFRDGYGSATALSLDLSQGVKGYPNLAAQGAPSASSVYPERDPQGNDIYAPAKAFDGITYSWVGWAPATGDRRPWLQVDLGAPARIRYIELYTRAQLDDPAARRNFEIRASNDPTFATFVVLAAQGNASLPHEAVFEAEVTDTGTYRYIRAAKTADESFFVTELRVLGQR